MSSRIRSLHQRLQEYLNCFAGSDTKGELLRLCKGGEALDVTQDPEEAAIKLLGLLILYGIQESASSIELKKQTDGTARIEVHAAGNYQLPGPPVSLAEKALAVMKGVTHTEGTTQKLVLGLGQDSLEVEVNLELDGTGRLGLTFPS